MENIQQEKVEKLKETCGGFNLITCNSLLVATHARLGAEIGAIGPEKELKKALDELGVYYKEAI